MKTKFVWDPKYSVHSQEIDEQHQRFFGLINALYNFLERKEFTPEDYLIPLTHLGDYAVYHFDTEESYFAIFRYKHAEHHKKLHAEFRSRIRRFIKRSEKPQIDVRQLMQEVANFAEEWLTQHILTEDRKYMPLFKVKKV
jgi:hemerythrin